MLKLRNQIFRTIKKKRPNYIKYNYPVLLLHFLEKSDQHHYQNPRADATIATDYLCLKSGHNNMSKVLADYLKTKFDYELDVVSFKNIFLFII